MSDHFNKLLLQRFEDIGTRLERLERRVDHVINEKADKTDVKDVKAEVKDVKLDVKDVQTELKTVIEKLD